MVFCARRTPLRGRLPREHTFISCRARARSIFGAFGFDRCHVQRVSRVNVLETFWVQALGYGLCILYRVRAGALALIVAFLASPGKVESPAPLILEKLHTRGKCVCTLPRLI